MPGGQVEEEESLIEAAIREAKEESGIDIEINKFCGVFQNVDRSICTNLFLGKAIGGEPATSSESLEVGFFDRTSIGNGHMEKPQTAAGVLSK